MGRAGKRLVLKILMGFSIVSALLSGTYAGLLLLFVVVTGGNYSIAGKDWIACGNIFEHSEMLSAFLINLGGSVGVLALSFLPFRYTRRRLSSLLLP